MPIGQKHQKGRKCWKSQIVVKTINEIFNEHSLFCETKMRMEHPNSLWSLILLPFLALQLNVNAVNVQQLQALFFSLNAKKVIHLIFIECKVSSHWVTIRKWLHLFIDYLYTPIISQYEGKMILCFDQRQRCLLNHLPLLLVKSVTY